jgi:leader peptidase (prepilin peptidase)/N-methyltransferase
MGFVLRELMAAVGAFLGWQGVIFSLIASSLIGSGTGIGLVAVRRREWSSRLPYGPFIALAAAIWIFFGKQILEYFRDKGSICSTLKRKSQRGGGRCWPPG